MRRLRWLVAEGCFLVALLGVLNACTSGGAAVVVDRMPVDVPDHFMVGTHTDTVMTEPTPGEGCRNPMVDPRDGTRLRLVSSAEGYGDYEVPSGRYGVGARELLRLACRTGQAVGIVR